MNSTAPRIEILEPRIAPASVLTFTDVDGDLVKITSTLGDLAGKATFAAIGAGEQLQTLDVTDASFQGAAISTTVTKKPGGDGLVNIGYINATGRDLASVTVKGDLGQIDAGDPDRTTLAVGKLSARSFGLYGIATQAAGTPSLQSDIFGPVGTLLVQTDVRDAFIFIQGLIDEVALGRLTLGGSLIGGATPNTGSIIASGGSIEVAKIRGDIVGGAGGSSGILSAGFIESAAVGGSIIGGDGLYAGRIRSDFGLGTIKVRHDIVGSDGDESGSILSRGNIGSVEIGGSILGGAGGKSGRVWTFNPGNDIGSVKVGKDVRGGSNEDAGSIAARGVLGALTVGGSVIGGSDSYTIGGDFAQISGAQGIGPVKIGGSLIGGAGEGGAQIKTPAGIAAVTISGSIIGGTAPSSGAIEADAAVGAIKIGGNIVGGGASRAGSIYVSNGDPVLGVASFTLGGSLVGGTDQQTGYFFSSNGISGAAKVGGNILGGSGSDSGVLDCGQGAKSISVRGSVIGFDGPYSGQILTLDVGAISVTGDLRGGDGALTGIIAVLGSAEKIVVGGSVVAGLGGGQAISAREQVGSLTIKGHLVGLPGAPVKIHAGDLSVVPSTEAEALAFRSITIGGDVSFAEIVAVNGSAHIGPVKVGGDWLASSIAAGVAPGPAGYGSAGDVPGSSNPSINSRIASITIKGSIAGTAAAGDHFGFVAREIGKFIGAGLRLLPGPATAQELSLVTGDVTLRTF